MRRMSAVDDASVPADDERVGNASDSAVLEPIAMQPSASVEAHAEAHEIVAYCPIVTPHVDSA